MTERAVCLGCDAIHLVSDVGWSVSGNTASVMRSMTYFFVRMPNRPVCFG